MRCSLRLAMISVDEGVIPCGRGIGWSLTAPSPTVQKANKNLPTCNYVSLNTTTKKERLQQISMLTYSLNQYHRSYLFLSRLELLFQDPQSFERQIKTIRQSNALKTVANTLISSKLHKGWLYLSVFPLNLHNSFCCLFSGIMQLMTEFFVSTTQLFNL